MQRAIPRLDAPHHDGSESYVSDPDPGAGDEVTVFLRVPHAADVSEVRLRHVVDGEPRIVEAVEDRSDDAETWWRASFVVHNEVVPYRFLTDGGPWAPDLMLKALVPVSLHGADEHGTLGNRVSSIYAPLPVGIGDPQARLAAVARSMRRLKSRPESDSMGLALDAANVLPAGAARLIARAVEHQRLVNLVVTNVPGPPVPLYAGGARMLEAFPVVPLDANMTVGVAVLSYDGALAISLTADDLACPDVDVFAAGIERSLAQLGVAAAEPRQSTPGSMPLAAPTPA